MSDKKPNYLAEGTWPCTVLGAECGEDKGLITARINVKIDDGPSKGRTCSYEDRVDAKSAPYVARSCKAVGWNGTKITETLVADVDKWIKATGGKSTVQIRYVDIKKGKKYDAWVDEHNAWIDAGRPDGKEPQPPIWDKVQSIGSGPKPLAAPSKTAAQDADEYLSRALADEGSAPSHDAPPPGDPNDIPFITSSWVRVDGGVL